MDRPNPSWDVERLDTPHYFPRFLWKFFVTTSNNIGPRWVGGRRVHVYDVHRDGLTEMRRIPQRGGVFADFSAPNLEEECLAAIKQAEEAFTRLEQQAEQAFTALLRTLNVTPGEVPKRQTIQLERHAEEKIRRYLIFLRYRNSDQYHDTIARLVKKGSPSYPWTQWIPSGPLRLRAVLRSLKAFLEHDITSNSPIRAGFIEDINEHCWKPYSEGGAEISVGIASEEQEFINTDRSYGHLDEVDPDGSSAGSYHLFFPVTPTVAVYLMTKSPRLSDPPIPRIGQATLQKSQGTVKRKREDDIDPGSDEPRTAEASSSAKKIRRANTSSMSCQAEPTWDFSIMLEHSSVPDTEPEVNRDGASASNNSTAPLLPSLAAGNGHVVSILCDVESVPDVHMRNSILLRSSPRYLLFSSLPSMVTAITVHDPTRTDAAHVDLSALKLHCRQKHVRESLVKTLVVKDEAVTDLTEEVVMADSAPVEYGSFADIWMGEWVERFGGKRRMVAVKVLRQCMANDLKEKLLKRLKDEVLTWHQLRHPNIAQLHGIVQLPHTLAMVSSWCKNGTVMHYIQQVNPSADRLCLLSQIASGVAYLHNFMPVVVHGDLKGNNILVNDDEVAVITDFGVSQVIEDFSTSTTLAASFLGGAIRWMAPELVLALVEDDGCPPALTMQSDVYAFAAVCLEIMTGKVPYPHRTNSAAVVSDKMRGVKPSRGAECERHSVVGDLWTMLDRCWEEWYLRPSMSDLMAFLGQLLKKRPG